jgi:site-specific recombinase XerD
MMLAFLEHLEEARGNIARSRNARLADVKSFFRYLEHRVPVVKQDTADRIRLKGD